MSQNRVEHPDMLGLLDVGPGLRFADIHIQYGQIGRNEVIDYPTEDGWVECRSLDSGYTRRRSLRDAGILPYAPNHWNPANYWVRLDD